MTVTATAAYRDGVERYWTAWQRMTWDQVAGRVVLGVGEEYGSLVMDHLLFEAALLGDEAGEAPTQVLSDLGVDRVDGDELAATLQSFKWAWGEPGVRAMRLTFYHWDLAGHLPSRLRRAFLARAEREGWSPLAFEEIVVSYLTWLKLLGGMRSACGEGRLRRSKAMVGQRAPADAYVDEFLGWLERNPTWHYRWPDSQLVALEVAWAGWQRYGAVGMAA